MLPEALEPRYLLAGGFPDPAVLGTFGGGWDFGLEQEFGSLPSTLEGRSYAPGAAPPFTMEIQGVAGQVGVRSLQWAVSAPADSFSPESVRTTAIGLSVDDGPNATGLIEAVAEHTDLASVTLHGADAQGRPAWQWTLSDVEVASYQAGGNSGGNGPGIQGFSLTYRKIAENYTIYNANGMPQRVFAFAWDVADDQGDAAPLVGVGSIPGGASQVLEIGGQLIPLDAFSWGEANAGLGTLTASDFTVSMASGAASPGLTSLVTQGTNQGDATITTRDGAGRVVAQWTLGNTRVIGLSTSLSGDAMADSVTLHAGQVQLTRKVYTGNNPTPTATYSGGWDFKNNHAWQAPNPTLLGITPGPGVPTPQQTLQIDGDGSVIPVDTIQWGESIAPRAWPGEDVHRVPSLSDVSLTIPAGIYSTGIFQDLAAGRSHAQMVLISRDDLGREVMRWTLTDALFTSLSLGGSPGDGGAWSQAVALSFSKIRLEYTRYDSAGNPLPKIAREWDVSLGQGDKGNWVATTYTPGTEPHLALDTGKGLIPVDYFSWSLEGPNATTQTGPTDTELSLSFRSGPWDPGIFASVPSIVNYQTLQLVTYDGTGHVTERWRLTDASVSSFSTSWSSGGGLGTDTMGISFGKVEHLVEDGAGGSKSLTYGAGWSFEEVTALIPPDSLGPSLVGDTFAPGGAAPEYTMQIDGVAGLTALGSFSWGASHDLSVGHGGETGSAPIASPFTFTLPLDRRSTGLFAAVAAGTSFDSVTIVRQDNQGRPIARWILSGVMFTSLSESGVGAVTTTPVDTVSLVASKVRVEWLRYDDQGKALPPLVSEWDFATNKG
ncbi:MAG TPA: type VI secretion system tube protein Hcp, partial [Tepidisphaeraceae bacterium]